MADLKLKDLRYLVAVADTRHFGRAAERSFVSQPTLSAQLKKLEEYLGVQLIERAPKRVALTAAGEEIVARARRILEASEEIVELARGPPRSARRAAQARAAADHRPLSTAARGRQAAQAAAAARAACCTSIRPTRCWRNCIRAKSMSESWRCRCRSTASNPTSSTRSRSPSPCPAHHRLARRSSIKVDDLRARNAAAARRRPLPARPGARHLLGHRRAREAGFPRHQPGDTAADGGGRRRHHAAAGARRPRRVRQPRAASPSSRSRSPCRRAPSAPCGASRARGAPPSSRCASRSRRTRCESREPRGAAHPALRAATGASSPRTGSPRRNGVACMVINARHGISADVLFQAGGVRRGARLRHAGVRLPRHGRCRRRPTSPPKPRA